MIQAVPPGTLYVVATPLGNLEDLTLRALRVLREVSLIACEDTRHTGQLLAAQGLKTPTTSFFEHNERWKGERILEALRAGRDVALVSDAGTPGISDPGFRLVRDARSDGLPVVPVPGPSAAIAALSVSGLPTDRFRFVGFLPQRTPAGGRPSWSLRSDRDTLVFYESPMRVTAMLADAQEALGDREAFLCREATKLHEEYRRGRLERAQGPASRARARPRRDRRGRGRRGRRAPRRGRVAGRPRGPPPEDGLTRRQAVKQVAERLGLPAREVYRLALDSNG